MLCPGHPDTLASRSNLAVAYESAGRLDQAIPLILTMAAGIWVATLLLQDFRLDGSAAQQLHVHTLARRCS